MAAKGTAAQNSRGCCTGACYTRGCSTRECFEQLICTGLHRMGPSDRDIHMFYNRQCPNTSPCQQYQLRRSTGRTGQVWRKCGDAVRAAAIVAQVEVRQLQQRA